MMALGKNAKIGIVVVVVAVIAIVIIINSISGKYLTGFINKPVNATQVSALESIAANESIASAVGAGIATFPKNISGASLLKIGGEPGVLYVGAEYCPFCASARWGLIVALMRFGTFSNLHYMISSTSVDEPYRGVPTFTFVGSTYSSPTIGFTAVELQTENYTSLQSMNASQSIIFNQYNYAQGSIPFIDFGNKSVQVGADYSPGLIQSENWGQIVSQLQNPNSPVAQGIIGSADVFTAQICSATGMQPASVCSQPYVSKILSSQ